MMGQHLQAVFQHHQTHLKKLLLVKLRQINILEDVLNVFIEPKVLSAHLKMEFINEKAVDIHGVSREAYSAFWEIFLEQCEGGDERVPRLRPDYSDKKWEALGRVWLKEYQSGCHPLLFSPVAKDLLHWMKIC